MAAKPLADAKLADVQIFGDFFMSGRERQLRADFYETNLKDEGTPGIAQAFLEPMSHWLKKGRFNIINLEGAITDAPSMGRFKRFMHRMPFRVGDFLRRQDIHGVTLGNNHSMDYGVFGLFQTLHNLEGNGIAYAGAGMDFAHAASPMIFAAGGHHYCVYSFNRTYPSQSWAGLNRPGTANPTYDEIAVRIRSCADRGLLTLAIFHWGAENVQTEQRYQRDLGRLAIDHGALAVVGHHSHVIGNLEWYKGRPIFYSIGNFLFTTLPGAGRKPEGLMVRITAKDGKAAFEAYRLGVDNRLVRYQPRVLGKEMPRSVREL